MSHTNPEPEVTVSVPVTIGGYTGQRDAWQEHQHSMAISFENDQLVLVTPNGHRRISIPYRTLLHGVKLVQQPQGPVPGGTTRVGVPE